MSANTKAPDSCPVCGGTDGIERRIYRETTIDRLTRERDLAREALERYEARVKRLEEALGLALKMRNDWLEMQEDGYAGAYYAFVKGNDSEWAEIIKAKEAKP